MGLETYFLLIEKSKKFEFIFKKGASDNTISYFEQSFLFSGLGLILAGDLGRSGQNKLYGTERV